MKISIIGTGYVGLVSGVCLAEMGHTVWCVDKDRQKIERIAAGKSPIHEAGLDELLEKNIHGRLCATTDLELAVLRSELTLIAVGTPFDGQRIDLAYVRQTAQQIGEALAKKAIITWWWSRAPWCRGRHRRWCCRSWSGHRAKRREAILAWG